MARVQYIQMSKFRANIFWYNLLWATCGPQQFANFWISKSIFYVKNYLNLSNFFSTLKNIIFRSTLLLFLFFENFNFWSTLFLEINLRSFSWSATHNLGHPSRDVRLQKLEGSKILVSLIKGVARLAENRYNWKSITFFKGRTKFLRFELCTKNVHTSNTDCSAAILQKKNCLGTAMGEKDNKLCILKSSEVYCSDSVKLG